MHSRIFGIVNKDIENYNNLVEETKETGEDYLYDLMQGEADYVSCQETDLNNDIEWLGSWERFRGEIKGTKLIITKQQVEDYMNEQLKYWQDTVGKMVDIDSFIDNKFDLTNDKGFYIYWNNCDIDNWDNFMEVLYDTFKHIDKKKIEFEIVKTWDYHF